MAHPLGEWFQRNMSSIISLFCFRLFDMRSGQLHLYNVSTELSRNLRRIGNHIERSLAILTDSRATRIRPDHDSQAVRLCFLRNLSELLVHLLAVCRAWID